MRPWGAEVAGKTAERQQEAYEEIRAEVEHGLLKRMGLNLPIYEGSLRHAPEPSEN